jgi:hypothetical protein
MFCVKILIFDHIDLKVYLVKDGYQINNRHLARSLTGHSSSDKHSPRYFKDASDNAGLFEGKNLGTNRSPKGISHIVSSDTKRENKGQEESNNYDPNVLRVLWLQHVVLYVGV